MQSEKYWQRIEEPLDARPLLTFSNFITQACATAGVGFFTDAYDIFAINCEYDTWSGA